MWKALTRLLNRLVTSRGRPISADAISCSRWIAKAVTVKRKNQSGLPICRYLKNTGRIRMQIVTWLKRSSKEAVGYGVKWPCLHIPVYPKEMRGRLFPGSYHWAMKRQRKNHCRHQEVLSHPQE